MPRKARLPQTPRHVLLYDEDWEYIETRFGPSGIKPIGVSNVIRAILHNKVLSWREAENALATAENRKAAKETSHANSPDI